MYARYIKRILDAVCAVAALLLLSPVMVVTMLMVRKKLGSPVFFSQKRPGKGGQLFKMYKFRTMTEEKDLEGRLLPDERRMTEFGRRLRSTSLDELPELLNILKGDMSFVGPRPLLPEYMDLYTEEQRRRHDVRPGLTGLAQVNGRNGISWEERFMWDIRYVERVSFKGDLGIISKTVFKVLKREGITSGSGSTMEPFTGSGEKINE